MANDMAADVESYMAADVASDVANDVAANMADDMTFLKNLAHFVIGLILKLGH